MNEDARAYEHPIYDVLLKAPGLSVAVAHLDDILTWGLANALWVFPMATSCCGIELMAAAASRVDIDRMGTIVRGTPRQADVMVIAGTITIKMAPKVKKLWDQMPEPKWALAMGSCAISGDFYRDLYPSIPGIDTVLPVDVYVPGCPPNPEALMHGLLRLQEKVKATRDGKPAPREERPETAKMLTSPGIRRLTDPARDPAITALQVELAGAISPDVAEERDFLFELDVLEANEPAAPRGVPAPSSAPVDEFATLLRERFAVTEFPSDAPPLVDVARHHELAGALKERGYRLLACVTASHWPAVEAKTEPETKASAEEVEVAYVARTLGPGTRVAAWRVRVAVGTDVPSLCDLFAAADWQEREQFDLVGVRFSNHPDLRRIMMPEDYPWHPLRRDRPSDAAWPPWR